jgi:hypothetical protein
MVDWISVEPENRRVWAVAQNGIFASRPSSAVLCPICRKGEFRFFFLRGPSGEDRGGSWFWCSHCHRFDHWTSLVPKWWRDVPGVSDEVLFPEPEWPNNHWEEIRAAQEIQ